MTAEQSYKVQDRNCQKRERNRVLRGWGNSQGVPGSVDRKRGYHAPQDDDRKHRLDRPQGLGTQLAN